MAKVHQSPGDAMRPRTWLHTDDAGWNMRKPHIELPARNFGAHDGYTTLILPHQAECDLPIPIPMTAISLEAFG